MINYKNLDISDTGSLLDFRLEESAILLKMFKG